MAIQRFERSLALARELGDRGYEAENLMMLGYCCTGSMGTAEYARAAAYARDGLAVAEASEQQWHLAPLRLLQADAWRCSGRTRAAFDQLHAELLRSEASAQPRFGIMALDMLGRLLHENGRAEEAEACFARALDSGRRHRVSFWRAQLLAGLAQARLQRRLAVDWPALRSASDAALAQRERFGHARCLAVLSEGALAAGDTSAARDDAGRLLALADPAGMAELTALAHWLLGRAQVADARRAEADYAAALHGAERIGRAWLAEQVLLSLAELCERTQRYANAADHRAAAALAHARFHEPELPA